MQAIGSLSGIEIAGAVIDDSEVGVERRRRRGGRSNHRRRNPIEITSEPAFDDCISTLPFTAPDDNSPVHSDSSVGYWEIYSCNQTQSVPITEEVDLVNGELETKVDSSEDDGKQCRICHLKFEDGDDEDDEVDVDSGVVMKLGCDCKGDLGSAHQKCAVTWFLIKGDLFCEICGSIVQNVGELVRINVDLGPTEEVSTDDDEVQLPELSMAHEPENGRSMHGRRSMNVLLGCVALAFVFTWLFHLSLN